MAGAPDGGATQAIMNSPSVAITLSWKSPAPAITFSTLQPVRLLHHCCPHTCRALQEHSVLEKVFQAVTCFLDVEALDVQHLTMSGAGCVDGDGGCCGEAAGKARVRQPGCGAQGMHPLRCHQNSAVAGGPCR